MKVAWNRWFAQGEILLTEYLSRRFEINEISKSDVLIRFLDRKKQGTAPLSRKRLDLLAAHYTKVRAWMESPKPMRLTAAVNKLWQQHGLDRDDRDESQYWALVCEHRRRKDTDQIDVVEFREGARILVSMTRVERNPKLRKACIEKHGLKCRACHMSFADTYGDIGDRFIHIHHLDPLKESKLEHVVSPERLVPVCANCHAMIHQRNPPYSPKDIERMIRKQMKAGSQKESLT